LRIRKATMQMQHRDIALRSLTSSVETLGFTMVPPLPNSVFFPEMIVTRLLVFRSVIW
jgi:hypothetical protein